MTHAYGYRRRTRDRFSKAFRGRGAIHMKKYLTKYTIGEYVDVYADAANHKSLPYKIYHGRTGRVFNVNPRSVGVVLTRQVKSRIVEKRIHLRVEHVRKSRCQEDFLKRVKENDAKKAEAKKAGKKISTKRILPGPSPAKTVKLNNLEYQNPHIFFEII